MPNNEFPNMVRAEIRAVEELNQRRRLLKVRRTDPELFVQSVIEIAQSLAGPKGRAYAKSFEFTGREFAYMAMYLQKKNGWSFDELLRELGINEPQQAAPGPNGEAQLITAFAAISQENPTLKPYRFKQLVERHMKRHLEPTAKPYTNQDVNVGAQWYLTTRKKMLESKNQTDPRSRSNASIPSSQWSEFYRFRKWGDNPKFARKFHKAVRDRARKITKRDKEQNSAK